MPSLPIPSYHNFHQKAFTLTELLVVMAVLGAISLVVFTAVNPQKRISDAQNANIISAAKQIDSAIEQFFTLQSHYPNIACGGNWCNLPVTDPAFRDQIVNTGILKEIPSYPAPSFANCEIIYFEKNAQSYQLSFCLKNFDARQSPSFTNCTLDSPGLYLCQNPPQNTYLCWYYESADLSRCFVGDDLPNFLRDFFPYP